MRRVLLVVTMVGMTGVADAQWVSYVAKGTPMTRDGRPNLTAPAPRTAKGTPDLSGVWQAEGASIPELIKLLPGSGGQNGLGEDIPTKYFVNLLADFAPGTEPLQPEAAAAARGLSLTSVSKDDVGLACLPSGVPLVVTAPAPFKFVQTAGLTVMLSEADNTFRQIFTDGRSHPADPTPSWMGSSVGHWDGDAFVVETIGFNDRGQLDAMGHRHSDALRVTERYRRRDYGHMDVEMTFTDPKTFTRPVTIKFGARLRPDTDLIEYFCSENEKDRARVAFN